MEGTTNISQVIVDNLRDIHNFPKEGITFKDISPLLANPVAFKQVTEAFAERLKGIEYDKLAVLESRGFIFGAPLSLLVNKGLVLIRKKGKLPGKVEQFTYKLEYGSDTVEIQADALKPGEKVVVIDDILATGGTAFAATSLIEQVGGQVVTTAFLYEIADLNGKEKLAKYNIISLHTM